MFCKKCGNEFPEGIENCPTCGEELPFEAADPYPYQATPQTSGKAIASMVVSIVGILNCLCCAFLPIAQIVGLVLGYGAKKEIRNSQGQLTGDGFATAGIIIGWVGIGLAILNILLNIFGIVATETGFLQ